MIYFDNSATSFPKDERVIRTMCEAYSRFGNPGRSGHQAAMEAAEAIFSCREAFAQHYGSSPDRIIFCPSATFALNMAIKGILKPIIQASITRTMRKNRLPKVLISSFEHNSVYRPLYKLEKEGRIELVIIPIDLMSWENTIAAFKKAIDSKTVLIVITHASNVCGHVLPITDISAFASSKGIPVVVDASQSGGHIPVDVDAVRISALCLAAHKGLRAPFGVTAMVLGKNCPALDTLIEGGTGSLSLSGNMPVDLPDLLEPGTQNAPAIHALEEALSYVSYIHGQSYEVYDFLKTEMSKLCNIKLFGVSNSSLPIILFNHTSYESEKVAAKLSEKGICVRGGYHCSPLAHHALGTAGGVRASFSDMNTFAEAEKFLEVLTKI